PASLTPRSTTAANSAKMVVGGSCGWCAMSENWRRILAVVLYASAMVATLFLLRWAIPKFGLLFFIPWVALAFLAAWWLERRQRSASVEFEPPARRGSSRRG